MSFIVLWDNGHACGELPDRFETYGAADHAGDNWRVEMIGMDEDPEAAADAYSYEVVSSE